MGPFSTRKWARFGEGFPIVIGTNPENPLANHIRINKKDVESVAPSRVSAMPEGLLNTLTREEVLDLLAYLALSQ